MSLNFTETLNTNVADIERPPLMPIGTYRWAVEKIPSIETTKDAKWDVVNFQVKCLGPQDDVDPDAIREFGDLTKVRQRHSFLFDKEDKNAFDRTLYGLKRFLADHLKIDGADEMPLKQALNASVNKQFLSNIVWRADKNDPEIQHANLGRTAPLD